jgi:hypothetical protein
VKSLAVTLPTPRTGNSTIHSHYAAAAEMLILNPTTVVFFPLSR